MESQTNLKAKATIKPRDVFCPSCHRTMDSGIVTASARCVNEHCELHNKRFAVDMPTLEVELREMD